MRENSYLILWVANALSVVIPIIEHCRLIMFTGMEQNRGRNIKVGARTQLFRSFWLVLKMELVSCFAPIAIGLKESKTMKIGEKYE